jgi:hypothetical protein
MIGCLVLLLAVIGILIERRKVIAQKPDRE